MKVRVFHEPPLNIRVTLELANGDQYPMQRVWTHEQDAGFQFDQAINVDRFMSETSRYPRRPIRLNLRRAATIQLGQDSAPAAIRNLSQQGACLECGAPVAIGQRVLITIDGLAQRIANVRWRRDNAFGLVFQDTLTLDHLAAFALACQPFPEEMDGWEDPLFPKHA